MVSAVDLVYLGKTEATYNEASPTIDNGPMLLQDASWMPLEADAAVRTTIRPFMGNNPHKLRVSRGRFQGGPYLSSSGAAGTAPAWRYLMRACGMAEVITAATRVEYTPVSAGFESIASRFYMENLLHKFGGGRGTWSLDMKAGDLPQLKFDIQGLYGATAVATHSTPLDFSAWIDPLPLSFDNTTLWGVAVKLIAFNYSHGNTVGYRDLPGRKEIVIAARAPSASVTIEVPTGLSPDFVALAGSASLGALQIIHGTVAGQRMKIDMSSVQILPDPKYGAEDGIGTMTLNLKPLPSAGDDEIKITAY